MLLRPPTSNNISQSMGSSSPPQTPARTSSPALHHHHHDQKGVPSQFTAEAVAFTKIFGSMASSATNITHSSQIGLGGSEFTFSQPFRPTQPTPCASSPCPDDETKDIMPSREGEEDDDGDVGDQEDNDDISIASSSELGDVGTLPPSPPLPPPPQAGFSSSSSPSPKHSPFITPPPPTSKYTTTVHVVADTAFLIEPLSDQEAHNICGVVVLQPSSVEEADSDASTSPSPSRARHPAGMDWLFNGMSNINLAHDNGDDSSSSEMSPNEFNDRLAQHRAERRHRRMTSGSVSKRTITESIGSDSDREDLPVCFDINEVGSSARRLRRRLGCRRGSLMFQDPPPPRIDELEEPPSSDDEVIDATSLLARELPYYATDIISMDVDSE